MPIAMPRSPMYSRQPNVTPASTETRCQRSRGSTESRYAASCSANSSQHGIETTRARDVRPSRARSRAASATETSEPVAMRIDVAAVREHVRAALGAGRARGGSPSADPGATARGPSARASLRSRSSSRPRSRCRRRGGTRAGSASRAAPSSARPAGGSGRPRPGRPSRASTRRSRACLLSAASRTRRPHVVAEHEERGDERPHAAVIEHAVADRAHRVLADAEPQVAALAGCGRSRRRGRSSWSSRRGRRRRRRATAPSRRSRP